MSLFCVNYITFLFWLCLFLFLIKPSNILQILLYSELIWIILYVYTCIIGSVNDDIIISTSFFLLALAGLEFSTGFLVVILFKNFKKTFSLVGYSTLNVSKDYLY